MNNRRRRTRVKFAGIVNLKVHDEQIKELSLVDISAKGVLVGGEVDLEPGTKCIVSLPLFSGSQEASILQMNGRVARVSPEGVAIDFLDMDTDTYVHLRSIVVLNAANPEAAEREFISPAFEDGSLAAT